MKILIADDSKAMRIMLRQCLRQAGYGHAQIVEAASGREAAKKIQQNPILVGSGVWLVLGAAGFAAVAPLEALISQTQAASLFAVILLCGLGFAAAAPGGDDAAGGGEMGKSHGSTDALVDAAVDMADAAADDEEWDDVEEDWEDA